MSYRYKSRQQYLLEQHVKSEQQLQFQHVKTPLWGFLTDPKPYVLCPDGETWAKTEELCKEVFNVNHNDFMDREDLWLELEKVNPYLASVILDVMKMHTSKAHDYATPENPFVNFEDVAMMAGTDVDTVFRQFIGVKLARLKNLLVGGKTPNNETIDDTRLDLAVYALLYLSYYRMVQDDTRQEAYDRGG